MRILAITGSTGKSGSVFIEHISNNLGKVKEIFPDAIRLLVRESSNTKKLYSLLPDAEKCKGDLTDIDFLKASFKNVDTVFHVAGVHWSSYVVQAAAFCHVRRLIFVHTTGIYSKFKAAGEEYRQIDTFVYDICEKNHMEITILRPTMIYGNIKDNNVITFIMMVDKFPITPVVNGAKYELQPVHYADLGKAYFQLLMNEGNTTNKEFILSGGAPILLRNMLEVIGNNLNKKVRFVSCPFGVAYFGAWVIYCLTIKKKDYREKVQRLCEPRVYSHDEATEAFGYNPMTFEQGIVQEVKDYKSGK
jgi:nucleoside-diphosphate-sugar epimerase